MAEHAGSGACIRFVDEREFKEVSVVDNHRVRKNRPPGFVLEPNCVESSSERSSEDGEVDCTVRSRSRSMRPNPTQGSCSGEISKDEGSKSKRPSRVTTTNRKSRASTSKSTTRAQKAKNNVTEGGADSM